MAVMSRRNLCVHLGNIGASGVCYVGLASTDPESRAKAGFVRSVISN